MQRNLGCPEDDRDVAGTHTLDGFIRDARKIMQAGPLWEQAWPDFLLWKCALFRKWKRLGLWERWCTMQLNFIASIERAAKALQGPGYGLSANCSTRSVVANHWLDNKVQCLDCSANNCVHLQCALLHRSLCMFDKQSAPCNHASDANAARHVLAELLVLSGPFVIFVPPTTKIGTCRKPF